MISGDFNTVLRPDEKYGGLPVSARETEDLRNLVDSCELQDIKSSGGPYTWSNKQLGNERVCCKLDRALVSLEWLLEFADSYISILNPGISDHSPLILKWTTTTGKGKKEFRFFNMWAEDHEFLDRVKEAWKREFSGTKQFQVVQKLKQLKGKLRELNRRKFCNIEEQYKEAQEQLNLIQTQLQHYPSHTHLQEQERACIEEVKVKAQAAMSYWEQKTKIEWCQMGDTNSKFFHAAIKEKVNRNKIISFQNDQGETIENWIEVKQHFLDYFQDLLGRAPDTRTINREVMEQGKTIRIQDQLRLIRPVTAEEIKKAMFDIHHNKSPGPDGYGSGFFKKTWEIVGESIVEAAQEFFRTAKLLKQVNTTLISLIPNNNAPKNAAEYRPISCCNSLYKCISKLLSERLGEILPHIVDENQGAFVKGRLLMHNVMITQELMRLYNRKSVKPSCLLKVDLRKAYDTISWRFIEDMMVSFGFPEKFIHLVMQCVSTCSFSVNLNGNAEGFFNGRRGIRQGDPISPLLFVLVMEYLTRLLKTEVRNGRIKFHHQCQNLEIVNLCFADDLILVCKAELETVTIIRDRLNEFAETTGLQANTAKSQIFCVGVSDETRERIKQTVGYEHGTFPMKYLGFPISPSKWNQADCQVFTDKIAARIRSWATRHLSYAGRVQLINSVLLQMHGFWSEVFLLPKSVIIQITKICRDFLWGTKESGRSLPLVSWKDICNTRSEGGLNRRNPIHWNEAHLGKQVWDLAQKKDNLWIKWMHEVDIKNQSVWDFKPPNTASWHVKQLGKVVEKLKPAVINTRWTPQTDGVVRNHSGCILPYLEGKKQDLI